MRKRTARQRVLSLPNWNLEKATAETLQAISRSEDGVSKELTPLFDTAVAHTPEEICRARTRKERGNPPGKQQDPLGDQLNWEQLLSHCKDESKLWIISNDGDYLTRYKTKAFLLNPFLHDELMRLNQGRIEVFCFNSLIAGIQNFAKVTKVRADKLPPVEESKEIEKELDALPPLGDLLHGMDGAYYAVLQNAMHRRNFVAAQMSS